MEDEKKLCEKKVTFLDEVHGRLKDQNRLHSELNTRLKNLMKKAIGESPPGSLKEQIKRGKSGMLNEVFDELRLTREVIIKIIKNNGCCVS